MSETITNLKLENNMSKGFFEEDKININTALTNDITNTRKIFNPIDNDSLSYFGENQQDFYSDNYNNDLELDEKMENDRWWGNENTIFQIDQQDNTPINPKTNNIYNYYGNFSLGDNNSNDNTPIPSPKNSNPDDGKTIQFTDLNIFYNYPLPQPEEKRKVKFLFVNNKRGRIPNEYKNIIIGSHTKKSIDNIERRVKVIFYDSTLECINELIKAYNQSQSGNEAYPQLKDIYSKIKKESSKKENLNLFNNNVSNMLSKKISPKFKNFPPDYNIQLIDRIYQEGKAKEVISFLDKSALLLYNQFIGDDKRGGTFKPLSYHIDVLKEKNLDKNYLDLIVETAKNFETNTNNKKPRDRKKKKVE